MICLGIESTAHTLSMGIVKDKEILVDVKRQYKPEKGGIVPNEAAEFFKKNKEDLLEETLEKSKLKIEDIDLIAISQGPGLPLSLHVGMNFAKELALENKKPLIGVNHLIGHLEIGKLLTKVKDPVFILATGANTQIIAFEDRYRIFGECLSIGLGNALDKFGRAVGIEFPAGPKIEELAKKGEYVELSYVVKGMDVEFSGIVTQAINLFNKGVKKEDLCYSLQETCFAMLTEVSERAMAHCNKKELLLIGGVAANKRLIEMLEIMCKEREAEFEVVPLEFSGDCGSQIAIQGLLEYKKEKIEKLDIKPGWRIDEVSIDYS